MKTIFAFLIAVASLQICSAQQQFNPPVRWLGGVTAANPGDCNAVGLGAIYEQIGNPATTATRISACVQTGASAYAWQPIAYKVQTAAPAVCNVGEVWFDSDATAGSNWFGCTTANTWTLLGSGGTGTVTSLATSCGITGGTITTTGTIKQSQAVNAQTGTSYTVLDGDCAKLITLVNAVDIAVTLPQANGSTFVAGWTTDLYVGGAGAVTITPIVSLVNSQATLIAYSGSSVHLTSDGTNFTASVIPGAGSCLTGTAGCVGLGQGTAPSVLGTNEIQVIAPTSVTSYRRTLLGAAGTGLFLGTMTSPGGIPTVTDTQVPIGTGVATALGIATDTTGGVCTVGGGRCAIAAKTLADGTGVTPLAAYVASSLPYVDAATISGGWLDSSGNGLTATLTGGAPTMNRSTVNGVPSVNFTGADWFTIPNGLSTNQRASTVYAVVEASFGATMIFTHLGADGGSGDPYYLSTANYTNYGGLFYNHPTSSPITGAGLYTSGPQLVVFVNDASGTTVYTSNQVVTGSALAAATNTGGIIGSYTRAGQYQFVGNIYETGVLPGAFTAAQVAQLFYNATATYKTPKWKQQAIQIISVGDSITSGANATLQLTRSNQSFPIQNNGNYVTIEREIGLTGQTMQTVAGASVADVCSQINSTYAQNMIVVAYGFNDLNINSRTAVQLETDTTTYVTALRACSPAPKIILLATVTPAGSGSGPEAQRQIYNTWLRSTPTASGADGIVDIGLDPVMDTYPANVTYYNAPHPNNLGYQRLAAVFTNIEYRWLFR